MTRSLRSRAPLAAALEFGRALRELWRTTLLFRVGGSAAVARATSDAWRLIDQQQVAGRAEPPREELSRSLRAMQRAKACWPARVECLQSSLALRNLYLRRGFPARLVVGVRMLDGELVSHAWVDVNGIAIDDSGGPISFQTSVGGERSET